ncbi:NAD(P)/FAD-dependent oxidoreductase [Falsigemmobacter faecalis]|uniref:FAD-binding oxidoreductase n=1 Tax=Falsigemmobacter faecalis TaxID=2488730 RepID=A0A3P3DLA4_9RHOB|nr:FAD-binding oxidoreductase [Falsigemmobacter faecalis]RRH74714.1 FAD-binding oxidoreductase [Falsigemmobacter faecalis]
MTDLTVLGAGIFGLSVAYEAAKRGARVQVIDPHGPGAGASGGVVGALAPHAPENWKPAKALQLQALLSAGAFWRGVEAAGGQPAGWARTGRVQPLKDARAVELAQARALEAESLWQGQARWFVREAGRPLDPQSPTGLVAQDDLTARIHPRMAVPALVAALTRLGGEVLRTGDLRGTVVHATGAAGLRELSETFGRPIGRGEKGQAALLAFSAPEAPQVYAPGLHLVFHADGTTGLGSTSERDYDDPESTDARLEALLELAVQTLPALKDARVISRWAGERPRAATRTVCLAPWPGREGHYIANGGFKTGFAMAPLAAGLLCDLIFEGRDAIPAAWALPA